MKRLGWALFWGALFGVGLVFSGMTQPGKVIGFLDVAGDWDPSLAFVMGGAIAVHATLRRLVIRREKPLLFPSFAQPAAGRRTDSQLVLGSAVFGVGWGLAGYCPGPALVASGSGSREALIVTAAMLLGIYAGSQLVKLLGAKKAPDLATAPSGTAASS